MSDQQAAGPVAGPDGSAPVWVGEQPVGDVAALARFVCRQACGRPRPSVTHDPYCVSMRRLVAERDAAVVARDEARAAIRRLTSLDVLFDALFEAQYGGMGAGADEREAVAQLAEAVQPLLVAALDGSGVTPE